MKKIFTLLSLMLVVFMAQATCKVTIHVDDPSHVEKVEFRYDTYYFNEESVITFETEIADNIFVYAADNCVFTNDSYEIVDGDRYGIYPNYAIRDIEWINATSINSIEFWYFTGNVEELRDQTCTINVNGDPENVQVQFANTSRFLEGLKKGENIVKFMKDESPFTINARNYKKPLYEVYLNGTKQTPEYNAWNLAIADGDILDVNPEWPDKDVTVTLSYAGDASADCIKYIYVGGELVTDYSKPIVSKAGTPFQIDFATINYATDYLKVNGVEQAIELWSVGYSCTLIEDITIEIKQTKRPCYTANVTVDDYTRITYQEGGVDRMPTSNNFVVEVAKDYAPNYPVRFIPLNFLYQIDECTVVDGESYYSGWDREYMVNLGEKVKEINVKTSVIDRPGEFSFYFNSPEKTEIEGLINGCNFECDNYSRTLSEEYGAGYSVLPFGEVDGEFSFVVYGEIKDCEKYIHAYMNNEVFEPVGEYYSYWAFTPENKDAFKVFVGEEAPVFYKATFSVDDKGAVKSALVDFVKDTAITAGLVLNELQETGVLLDLADGYIVKLNGEQILPIDEDIVLYKTTIPVGNNTYYFDIVRDLKVEIIKDESGISAVTVTDDEANPAVYNMLGVKVSNGSTDNLPSGFYVQKGRKIYVK